MTTGGIILCGGKSSRMGMPKATLPFGSESMLQRVHRLLSEVVEPIVVVAAKGQELPALPAGTLFAQDERSGYGPLEGMLAGMKVLHHLCDHAYISGCDVPLLQPALVRQLISRVSGYDAVAIQQVEFIQPLSAVYRTNVIPVIEAMLARDQLSPRFLLQQLKTLYVSPTDVAASDPELLSLRNLNRPEDYFAALQIAEISIAPELTAKLRAMSEDSQRRDRT